MATEGGQEGPPSTGDQTMSAERVDQTSGVSGQPETSPRRSLLDRLKGFLGGVKSDMESGQAQKLNPLASPPVERTPPTQTPTGEPSQS